MPSSHRCNAQVLVWSNLWNCIWVCGGATASNYTLADLLWRAANVDWMKTLVSLRWSWSQTQNSIKSILKEDKFLLWSAPYWNGCCVYWPHSLMWFISLVNGSNTHKKREAWKCSCKKRDILRQTGRYIKGHIFILVISSHPELIINMKDRSVGGSVQDNQQTNLIDPSVSAKCQLTLQLQK